MVEDAAVDGVGMSFVISICRATTLMAKIPKVPFKGTAGSAEERRIKSETTMADTDLKCNDSDLFEFWCEVSVDEADEFSRTDRVLKFSNGLGFDLTDTFAGDFEDSADFFECVSVPVADSVT